MDPAQAVSTSPRHSLSIALADVISIAINIEEAFSQLPQNYRNAKKAAANICETLEQVQWAYQTEFGSAEDLETTTAYLIDLKDEMSRVYHNCTVLIPPIKVKKRGMLALVFYSLRNRTKVDELLVDLEDRVDKLLSMYIVQSNMRIERVTNRIAHTIAYLNFISNSHFSQPSSTLMK